MASFVRNGAETATTTLATFLTVPADTDERIEVRATNINAAAITVDFAIQNPAGTVTKYVARNVAVGIGEAIDIFPSGLKLGAGWKLQHRASIVSALDTVWSANPAV
jgi:hypothetical protein